MFNTPEIQELEKAIFAELDPVRHETQKMYFVELVRTYALERISLYHITELLGDFPKVADLHNKLYNTVQNIMNNTDSPANVFSSKTCEQHIVPGKQNSLEELPNDSNSISSLSDPRDALCASQVSEQKSSDENGLLISTSSKAQKDVCITNAPEHDMLAESELLELFDVVFDYKKYEVDGNFAIDGKANPTNQTFKGREKPYLQNTMKKIGNT